MTCVVHLSIILFVCCFHLSFNLSSFSFHSLRIIVILFYFYHYISFHFWLVHVSSKIMLFSFICQWLYSFLVRVKIKYILSICFPLLCLCVYMCFNRWLYFYFVVTSYKVIKVFIHLYWIRSSSVWCWHIYYHYYS